MAERCAKRQEGSNVLGSPLAAIAYLLAVLEKQPQYMPLQADEMVTTGTVTTAQSVRAGETWRTEIEDKQGSYIGLGRERELDVLEDRPRNCSPQEQAWER